MKKGGGIVALIAGICGVTAAGFTLFTGGLGAAFGAEGADAIIGFGWGGIVFSFLTIVFGAVAMGARGRVPGVLLILCAFGGAILGGPLVAVFMAFAAAGGGLAVVGRRETTLPVTTT